MSLGLGILLSTILVITAWQIDKRQAWRRVGRVTIWVIAATVVAGIATYGYVWSRGKSKEKELERQQAAEVAKVREPNGLAYWGLSLGMSKPEVRYLKGDPIETKSVADGAAERWTYKFGKSPIEYTYEVYWDKIGTHVIGLLCQGPGSFKCERLAGVGPGVRESEVRKTLGSPSEDRPPDDKGWKFLRYGSGDAKVVFFLSRSRVDGIALLRKEAETTPPSGTATAPR
jgi:hypothetical protein